MDVRTLIAVGAPSGLNLLPWIPEFDPPRRAVGRRGAARRWTINLGDEWRPVASKEALDMRQGYHKGSRKVWKRCFPDNHQQGDAVPHDRVALSWFVSNTAVVSECYPTALTNLCEPNFVGCIMSKVIGVPLDHQAACHQNCPKLLSQVAVGEIDAGQAARSYTTASSMSDCERS